MIDLEAGAVELHRIVYPSSYVGSGIEMERCRTVAAMVASVIVAAKRDLLFEVAAAIFAVDPSDFSPLGLKCHYHGLVCDWLNREMEAT